MGPILSKQKYFREEKKVDTFSETFFVLAQSCYEFSCVCTFMNWQKCWQKCRQNVHKKHKSILPPCSLKTLKNIKGIFLAAFVGAACWQGYFFLGEHHYRHNWRCIFWGAFFGKVNDELCGECLNVLNALYVLNAFNAFSACIYGRKFFLNEENDEQIRAEALKMGNSGWFSECQLIFLMRLLSVFRVFVGFYGFMWKALWL